MVMEHLRVNAKDDLAGVLMRIARAVLVKIPGLTRTHKTQVSRTAVRLIAVVLRRSRNLRAGFPACLHCATFCFYPIALNVETFYRMELNVETFNLM